jgi:hypothetical protein
VLICDDALGFFSFCSETDYYNYISNQSNRTWGGDEKAFWKSGQLLTKIVANEYAKENIRINSQLVFDLLYQCKFSYNPIRKGGNNDAVKWKSCNCYRW